MMKLPHTNNISVATQYDVAITHTNNIMQLSHTQYKPAVIHKTV